MQAIDEIKAWVEKLPRKEQADLLAWLIERDHAVWDEQIKDDQRSGRLDQLIGEARADRLAGRARDL